MIGNYSLFKINHYNGVQRIKCVITILLNVQFPIICTNMEIVLLGISKTNAVTYVKCILSLSFMDCFAGFL